MIFLVVVCLGLIINSVNGCDDEALLNVPDAELSYLYFYPLLTMEATRLQMTKTTGMNTFDHFTSLPASNFTTVVRPNFDTLYSVAWLNVSEPLLVITRRNLNSKKFNQDDIIYIYIYIIYRFLSPPLMITSSCSKSWTCGRKLSLLGALVLCPTSPTTR